MFVSRSLKLRLPLLIVALLGTIVVGFGWSAYHHLTRTFEQSAGERLARANEQLTSMLLQQSTAMMLVAEKLAAFPSLSDALAKPGSATAEAARREIADSTRALGAASRRLWTRDCTVVLAVGPPLPRDAAVCPLAPIRPAPLHRTAGARAWVQPFVASGDSIRYEVVTPVIHGASDTLGYLVDTRTLNAERANQAISGLIGKDVVVMLGNGTGPRLWTDLSVQVDGPSTLAAHGTPEIYRDAEGTRHLGVAREVPRTPWIVWVRFPFSAVVEPELAIMRDLGIIAIVCILIGVVGAWIIGQHVTTPLIELTSAAEDLAHGNYARRLTTRRTDELGLLVHAFNRMAVTVDDSSRGLMEQAAELQSRAEQAQDLAQELELSNQELIDALEEATLARRDVTTAESLLNEVIVQAPVGIAVFDQEMRYVRLNQAVADIHGVPLESHYGQRPGEVLPAVQDLEEPLLERVLATGEEVLAQRLSRVMPDGTKRHWLFNCFPIRRDDGALTGVGSILVDNTAHQELEARLLQAQKMDAVGRLAGGIAHDFNNLLTVITSYSGMALGSLRANDPLYHDMREIQSAAERAARLTKQLLAFSRKQVLRPELLDLSYVASEMESMLKRLIGEDVVLDLHLAADLGAISADPGQIEQVIMNLVVNARDAMPDGGHVGIETMNVSRIDERLSADDGAGTGEYVLLSVTDTGTGMSEATQANLFEPFFTTKAVGSGTGLGLATVYGIVKQSGGDIRVRSELGRGTSFRIYFPCVPRPEVDRRRTPAAGLTVGGRETILLVEDDAPLRQLAARLLRDAGYTVLDTHTPTEAVLTGTHHPGTIDLLLTDVVMPQMSGRTVAELLTKQRPSLNVLFMSGYTDDEVVRRGVVATDTLFLQKPFTPAQLLSLVRTVISEGARARAG